MITLIDAENLIVNSHSKQEKILPYTSVTHACTHHPIRWQILSTWSSKVKQCEFQRSWLTRGRSCTTIVYNNLFKISTTVRREQIWSDKLELIQHAYISMIADLACFIYYRSIKLCYHINKNYHAANARSILNNYLRLSINL